MVRKISEEETAVSIVKKLRKEGFKSYFAGGCVRDKLMNLKSTDYDIATEATPDDVSSIFKKTIPVGVDFGVVVVVYNKKMYEVATFRNDSSYSDGRHPDSVEFTNDEEDAKRRDFTINGMFYDPLTDTIIDYVDGKKDIKKKIIRAIGSPLKRFSEDALRMIRAVRFAVRFDFKIEEETLSAIKTHAGSIKKISPERIREEMTKILVGKNSGNALKLLYKTGLLQEILPEVVAMYGVEQPKEFHPEGDVFEHTVIMLNEIKNNNEILAWSVLLHDVGKPKTFFRASDRIRFNNHNRVGARIAEKICKRLKFSNNATDAIYKCVDNHMNFMNVQKMRVSTLKKMMRYPTFKDELELHRLDCFASHGDLSNWKFLKEKLSTFKEDEISPKLFISGKDLIKSGYKPGPIFNKILNEVEVLQLENKINNKEQALEYVNKIFREVI